MNGYDLPRHFSLGNHWPPAAVGPPSDLTVCFSSPHLPRLVCGAFFDVFNFAQTSRLHGKKVRYKDGKKVRYKDGARGNGELPINDANATA
jgi:hypothetical protein